MMSDDTKEFVVGAGKVKDLAKARVLGTDLIVRLPDDMFINLMSGSRGTAEAINDDPEWRRVLVLLGSLYRKHGSFVVEVAAKTVRSIYGVQPR